MNVTLREVAEWIGGEVIGDRDMVILGTNPIHEAKSGDLTLLEDERLLKTFLNSSASAAVVAMNFPMNDPLKCKSLLRVQDPLMSFVSIIQHFNTRPTSPVQGIHPSAIIHPSAEIGEQVTIGPFVSIGENVKIGQNCQIHAGVSIGNNCELGHHVILYPHVVLYANCFLGNEVIIHANSVIGADGFGYRLSQGEHRKVPQLGRVEIADRVEIGACTTIDRATFGATRVGYGTKIDNLVMIGHNCNIGKHNLFVSQVGIAGSVTTGDYVVMAGQVGIADHLHIGSRSQLGAKCGVHKDVPSDQQMLGTPATPAREQMRIMSLLEKLPEIRRDVRKIKELIGLREETQEEIDSRELPVNRVA